MKSFLIPLCAVIALSGCTPPSQQAAPNLRTPRSLSQDDKKQGRRLQVYFDGTANKWSSRTNVRRRFELISSKEDPVAPCLYVDGVGNGSTNSERLAGITFGYGLKARILVGYKFLARTWASDKDQIHLFGFSRGAFQARTLAGMIAHCGLPDARQMSDHELDEIAATVWDLSRNSLSDAPERSSSGTWEQTLKHNRETTTEIVHRSHPNVVFHAPRIRFMGLWDTVPGLQFTKVNPDGTRFVKDNHKYKIRPYPNIDVIVHALSLDEKRTQFTPLLVGPPLDSAKTKVYEVWFPGAHSDIGGGYMDSNDMAGVSANWMGKILKKERIVTEESIVYADATGIYHHPERDSFLSLGSHKVSRKLPVGSVIDRTVFIRATREKAPERSTSKDDLVRVPYRPVIPLQDNQTKIRIGPARTLAEQQKVLAGKLKLNDSDQSPAAQKPLQGKPLELKEMFATPVPVSSENTPHPTDQSSPSAATPEKKPA